MSNHSPVSLLFPPRPRSFPGRRGVKIALRALHVLAAGIVTASYLFGVAESLQTRWLVATAATGVAILLLDLHESGVFLLQVRGLVVLAKTGLLGALPFLEELAGWVLAVLLVMSVVSSHATGKFRYHVVFGKQRFEGAETKG
jgi:hypothetical protein